MKNTIDFHLFIFLEYVVSNFPTGLNWNVKGTADFNALLNDIKNAEKATEAPAEQVVPNKAAMFAQINQGSNVTSGKQ